VIGNGHAGFGRGDAGKGPARAPRQHPYLTRSWPNLGKALSERQHDQPQEAVGIAWTAQKRLHRTWTRLEAHGKRRTIIAVAAARELAGFVWAITQIE
jgi:hypothetical protein